MLKIVRRLDDVLACMLIATITVITIGAVFMRYIVGNPLQWVEELVIALFIWAIMLGSAAAMKRRQHVSIDVLTSLLPVRYQHYSALLNDVIMIGALSLFGWLGWELALGAEEKITPILGISYFYIDLAVPVGSAWMVVYCLCHLWRGLTTKEGGV